MYGALTVTLVADRVLGLTKIVGARFATAQIANE